MEAAASPFCLLSSCKLAPLNFHQWLSLALLPLARLGCVDSDQPATAAVRPSNLPLFCTILNTLILTRYSYPWLPHHFSALLLLLYFSVPGVYPDRVGANTVLKLPYPFPPKLAFGPRQTRNWAYITSFESESYALFSFPYPLSPFLAALTNIAGVD